MSITAGVWIILAVSLSLLSLRRPVWALAFYMLTFFAAPYLWWWGDELPDARYALVAGVTLLVSVVVNYARPATETTRRVGVVHRAAVVMVLNATLVHFLFAPNLGISVVDYVELLKFTLLSFLIWLAIQDKRDFRVALMAIAIGSAYIGYEVTINERGSFTGSRLEGVGAPAADTSNGLASVMMLVLPLIGSLFIGKERWGKLIVLVAAPLTLNVLLLCNSRGAFLGLVGSAFVFLLLARGPTRKKAVGTLVLASIVLYLLLGDPKILDRFSTTFVGSEDRDASAAGRLEFWRAGMLMLSDLPFGAGGGAFKWVYANRYLAQVGSEESARSLHNGFLTEATDWGVQGLLLKMIFIGAAVVAAYRTSAACRKAGRLDDALVGVSLIVSATGFLITCIFGSFLGNEWTYWIVGFLVRYAELYRVSVPSAQPARAPFAGRTIKSMSPAVVLSEPRTTAW